MKHSVKRLRDSLHQGGISLRLDRQPQRVAYGYPVAAVAPEAMRTVPLILPDSWARVHQQSASVTSIAAATWTIMKRGGPKCLTWEMFLEPVMLALIPFERSETVKISLRSNENAVGLLQALLTFLRDAAVQRIHSKARVNIQI